MANITVILSQKAENLLRTKIRRKGDLSKNHRKFNFGEFERMICPNCGRSLVYNAILKLYYCIKEHGYYKMDNDGKLEIFREFTF